MSRNKNGFISMGLNPNCQTTCGWPKCGHLKTDGNSSFGWCQNAENRAEPSKGHPNGFTPSVSYSGGCNLHTALMKEVVTRYQWETSPDAVAGVVCEVARSQAPYFEFALGGPFADAANEAATLGLLSLVGNGLVAINAAGRLLAVAKDATQYAMTYADTWVLAGQTSTEDLYVVSTAEAVC